MLFPVSRTARATSNTSPVREIVPMIYHGSDDDESDVIFADESDDSNQLYSPLQKKNKSTPSGIKSPNKQAGVVPQENDLLISLTNDQYKEILDEELEKLVGIREEGKLPDIKESAKAIIEIFKYLIQRSGGRYLQLKKKPPRYVEVDEEEVVKKLKFDLARESSRRCSRRSEGAEDGIGFACKSKRTIQHSDDESNDITTEESNDDSSQSVRAMEKKGKSKPSGVKSPNGHASVVPQENDIIISVSDERYKKVLATDIEKLAKMRKEGKKFDAKELATVIIKQFKQRILGEGGRYLILKRSPRIYVEIDEHEAEERVRLDLCFYSREAKYSQMFGGIKTKPSLKRRKCHDKQSPNPKKKDRLDNGWGSRPKRATQQLRDDMMYKEIMRSTLNPIGRDIVEYTINGNFDSSSLIVEEDKFYCIGQMIAKELICLKGHRWAVMYCEVKGKSEFVTFKDCHNSNAQMAEALNNTSATPNGRAFIGYGELAQFMLQNGLLETSIKNTAEIKEMLKTFDIPGKSTNEETVFERTSSATEQRQQTLHQSTNIDGANLSGDQSEPTTRNSTLFAKQKTGEEGRTSLSVILFKAKQVKQLRCQIGERLKNIEEGKLYGSDDWKKTHATSFYSNLMKHLVKQLNDKSLDVTEFREFTNEFEKAMEELTAEESNLQSNIVNIEYAQSMIRFMIEGVENI